MFYSSLTVWLQPLSSRAQCWGMDSVSANCGKMVESDEQPKRDSGGGGGGAAMAALHQCELIQNMIEISISSLQGLRTKCAASNDLTQQEIRTLEVRGPLFFILKTQKIWMKMCPSFVLLLGADESKCGVMKPPCPPHTRWISAASEAPCFPNVSETTSFTSGWMGWGGDGFEIFFYCLGASS